MLEHAGNQAAGLLDLAVAPAPRLIAMVTHGDATVELPLLLQLCNALVNFGHPVIVLDGTVMESQDNPGLAQLLDDASPANTLPDSPSWTVLPARLGLQTLQGGTKALENTGRLFPLESVVIVYSTAQTLAPLLRGSRVRPVLATSKEKTSLLTSYVALKRLLLKGSLEPTIVNVVDNERVSTAVDENAMPTSLNDCAKYFLNYQVNALNITAPTHDERPSATMGRLVLGLLENALPLQCVWSTVPQTFAPFVYTPLPKGAH